MGIRTGKEYLDGLRDDREIWINGDRIEDVTKHPAVCRGAHTLGEFLDRQHNPKYQDKITYLDEDGDRCATSFLIPKSEKDVKRRGASFYEWASWSAGMLGRTPDYKNASVMSFAAANAFLGKGETNFSENMVNFYNEIRKGDKGKDILSTQRNAIGIAFTFLNQQQDLWHWCLKGATKIHNQNIPLGRRDTIQWYHCQW